MPATPSQLRRPIVIDHTVDFGAGVTVTFTYDRNKMTDAWMQEWSRLESQADAGPKLNEMLDDLIIQWDVQNEDGSPYPKTAENIGFLFSVPDKGRIFGELLTAAIPSRAEGNALSAPTSTALPTSMAPGQMPPNGTEPSPSPTPSASPSPT